MQANTDSANLQVTWVFGSADRPQLQSFGSSDQTSTYVPPGKNNGGELHVPAVMVDIDHYVITPRRLRNSRGIRIELQGCIFGYGDLDGKSSRMPSHFLAWLGSRDCLTAPRTLLCTPKHPQKAKADSPLFARLRY